MTFLKKALNPDDHALRIVTSYALAILAGTRVASPEQSLPSGPALQ